MPSYISIFGSAKISNLVYTKLIDVKTNILKKKTTWENRLEISIEDEHFITAFKNIQVVTIATKYRDFQYRLIHNAIITNKHLCRWNLRTDDLCSFCNLYSESILHLFYSCECIQEIWQEIRAYIESQIDETVATLCQWNAEEIFFNRVHPRPAHVINFVILVVKQYIY